MWFISREPNDQAAHVKMEAARTFRRPGAAFNVPFSMGPQNRTCSMAATFSLLPYRFSPGIPQLLTPASSPDSEISSSSDLDTGYTEPNETLTDRIIALKDIIPPRTRARIASTTSSIYSFTGSAITYGGKGLWVLATSAFLLGIPYALALGQEQEIMEEEKRQGMMSEGASALLQPGEAAREVKQSL
jgi:import receptor subunit TOM22